MEMVDMGITKIWISGPKSRSVNIVRSGRISEMDTSYSVIFGNLGTNVANGSIRILTLDITSRIYI